MALSLLELLLSNCCFVTEHMAKRKNKKTPGQARRMSNRIKLRPKKIDLYCMEDSEDEQQHILGEKSEKITSTNTNNRSMSEVVEKISSLVLNERDCDRSFEDQRRMYETKICEELIPMYGHYLNTCDEDEFSNSGVNSSIQEDENEQTSTHDQTSTILDTYAQEILEECCRCMELQQQINSAVVKQQQNDSRIAQQQTDMKKLENLLFKKEESLKVHKDRVNQLEKNEYRQQVVENEKLIEDYEIRVRELEGWLESGKESMKSNMDEHKSKVRELQGIIERQS